MKLSKKVNNLNHANTLGIAIFRTVNRFSNCLNRIKKMSILVTYHTSLKTCFIN